MNNPLSFLTRQGAMSDPGPYAHLYNNLPTGIADLCKVVQGTTIHVFWAQRYGLELTDERRSEVQLRTMPRRLSHMIELDDRPPATPRPLDRKLVGNCRDFSLMLVS